MLARSSFVGSIATITVTLLAGCAAARRVAPPQSSPPPPSVTTTDSVEAPAGTTECELYCEPPQMLPRALPEPDYTQREVENADLVLASMTDNLLGCYKKRLRARPEAHGSITVDILIGEDGRVRNVETTGGAILGDVTMGCIVHRIEKGAFEPPHGGGTLHVRVPFSLRRVAPGDAT